MKILILGYGKMGHKIEELALGRNHEIIATIDQDNQKELNQLQGESVDVAIEFSQPDAAFDNIMTCLEKNIPVVSGTTGWLDRKAEVEAFCNKQETAFFYASNFSIGVNLFFKLNEFLARLMQPYQEYSTDLEEIHHTQKKDAPSGTAITLAEGIIENQDKYDSWINNTSGIQNQLPIVSKRIDKVPGTHIVKYSSYIDEIEIKHTAHSREGFALGAVLAAEWIEDKKGIFSMKDFLQL